MTMINDELLGAFINGFYGYGNYQAPYWFVGMEEGGGNSIEEIAKRIETWDKRGRKELEDVAEYSREIGINRYFDDRAKLQSTWNKLIRIVLTAEGQIFDTETVREYQRSKFGTEDGDTCLLELLPLPSPNIASWLYGENSKLAYLTNRETYRNHIVNSRIAHLQDIVTRYQPKAVIFYGAQYVDYWKRIAGIDAWERSPEGISFGVKNSIRFVASNHPVATGIKNEYFHTIGKLIAG